MGVDHGLERIIILRKFERNRRGRHWIMMGMIAKKGRETAMSLELGEGTN